MKQFIEKYFTIIVFVLLILTFFKGCNDSREITKVKKEITELRDSVATKSDIRIMNQKTEDFQNTLYGFGDSFYFLMNKFTDESIENQSNQRAMKIYSDKVKELNLDKK